VRGYVVVGLATLLSRAPCPESSLVASLLGPGATSPSALEVLGRDSPAPPPMIRLARVSLRLGSTREQVLEAAQQCNREAGTSACTLDDFADELGGPELIVEAFWLDRREVSLGDYQHCVEQGHCRPLPYEHGGQRFEQPELPAVFVTWHEATEYCVFRGARLPTEAEFERAARGRHARRYPWGSQFHGALANHGRWGVSRTDAADGYPELAPVESFANGQTPEGIIQLSGNVAEWTATTYAPYDAPEPPGRGDRVVRGGHYLTSPAWLRGAARLHEPPHRRAAYLGFRCARSDP
jgi:formylglycine-generating enzyme